MTRLPEHLTIGELSARSGLAPSALRYYEAEGLITALRSVSGRRTYDRAVLRRVAFVRAAQQVGLTLAEIKTTLGTLPSGRTPTKADWARLSRAWRPALDAPWCTVRAATGFISPQPGVRWAHPET